jgi:adenine-specific DNA methylase
VRHGAKDFKVDLAVMADLTECEPPGTADQALGRGSALLGRLGCEAYALDLNPVAHIIELCALAYPQKLGKPDPKVRPGGPWKRAGRNCGDRRQCS